MDSETQKQFFAHIVEVSEKAEVFFAGIGEFFLSVKADFSDDAERTPEDVFHEYRKKGVERCTKHYKKKPTPQVYWLGEWEKLK